MRWLPFAAACIVSSLLLYGCGRSGATVSAAAPAPILRNAQISPQNLQFDFAGGTVTVKVTVDSAKQLRAVTAELVQLDKPGAVPQTFPLAPTTGFDFQASIQVPANVTANGVAARYRLSVYAEDVERVVSEPLVYTIQVAPPDSPPAPAG